MPAAASLDSSISSLKYISIGGFRTKSLSDHCFITPLYFTQPRLVTIKFTCEDSLFLIAHSDLASRFDFAVVESEDSDDDDTPTGLIGFRMYVSQASKVATHAASSASLFIPRSTATCLIMPWPEGTAKRSFTKCE